MAPMISLHALWCSCPSFTVLRHPARQTKHRKTGHCFIHWLMAYLAGGTRRRTRKTPGILNLTLRDGSKLVRSMVGHLTAWPERCHA